MSQYNENEIEGQMIELFENIGHDQEHEQPSDFPDVGWATSFDEYGVLTRNKGFVIKIGESVFDITIVQRK